MVRLTCISVARNPSWYRLKRSLLKYSLDLGSAFVAEPARRREERKEKRKDEQKDRRQDGIDGRGTRRSVAPSYTAGGCRFRWISCYPTGFAEIGAKGCRVLCRSRAERNTQRCTKSFVCLPFASFPFRVGRHGDHETSTINVNALHARFIP